MLGGSFISRVSGCSFLGAINACQPKPPAALGLGLRCIIDLLNCSVLAVHLWVAGSRSSEFPQIRVEVRNGVTGGRFWVQIGSASR